MAKKIYFAGSIRGGRVDADLYYRIITYIQRTAIVLTEHVGKSNLSLVEQGRDRDACIYDQDTVGDAHGQPLLSHPSLRAGGGHLPCARQDSQSMIFCFVCAGLLVTLHIRFYLV